MLTRNRRPQKPSAPGTWKLQDAKARFSELVRRAQSEGPQRVTTHGKDAVVVLSTADYAKLKPAGASDTRGRTGADLIAVMQKGRRLGLKLKRTPIYLSSRPPIDFSDSGK
jgi:prevent-host-death family protein